MKPTFIQGLEHSAQYTVTKEMSPAHMPTVVLSTPTMVGLIEGTCMQLLGPHLDDTEISVGTHICVSHTGAATENEEFTITVRVKEIDRRRVTFESSVISPRGSISEGTHQRAVVDQSRFS